MRPNARQKGRNNNNNEGAAEQESECDENAEYTHECNDRVH